MPNNQQLLKIIDIQTRVAQLGANLGAVMDLVASQALTLAQADGSVIELVDGDWMVYQAASGIAERSLGLRIPAAGSLSGLCIAQRAVLRSDDTEADERVNREACRQAGVRSMIVLPLRHGETTVGVLKVMSAEPSRFNAEHEATLSLLSGVVSAAMYFATQYDLDELFYRATHDPLTGLANRALMMDRLRAELAQASRDQRLVAVLVIDMDGLKTINDTLGHAAGDAAIGEFGRRLAQCARRSDTISRIGGDEFAVMLTPIDSEDGVATAVNRLNGALSAPFLFETRVVDLRASVGTALFPNDGDSLESVLEIADQRMYKMKRERKTSTVRTNLQ